MSLRKENLVRVAALIFLCALVYYFSFDQGRTSESGKIRRLEQTVAAKERVIETLAGEIDRLKKELAKRSAPGTSASLDANADSAEGRFTIRVNTSRMLFDNRAAVACLGIDRDGPQAVLQFNDLRDGTIKTQTMGVGKALGVDFGDQSYTVVLEQIYPSYVSVRVIGN